MYDEKNIKSSELAYHSSWDLLMPVVKKIFDIDSNNYPLEKEIEDGLLFVDITLTFNSAVNFLKWYNTQTK